MTAWTDSELLRGRFHDGEWLEAALAPSGNTVASLVPAGYSAFTRILHPPAPGNLCPGTSWAEIARRRRKTVHPGMQWEYIAGSEHPLFSPTAPDVGRLPPATLSTLRAVLSRFTAAGTECYFGFWEGKTYPVASDAARLSTPAGPMVMFSGTIERASDEYKLEGVNLWWPRGKQWFVNTNQDLTSTYVAGSRECIDAVLTADSLEAFVVTPTADISVLSDNINRPSHNERP